jgi:selenocysteine lyase/cysteine desulfurase
LHLAAGARRFDVSPAWHAWVGAEAALELAAGLDMAAVRDHDLGLSAAFRARLDLPIASTPSAIVTWPDPDGADLAALTAAGVTASGRAGRARVAFHLWNDFDDVELAARALGR